MGDVLMLNGPAGDAAPWYRQQGLVAMNDYDTPDSLPFYADEDIDQVSFEANTDYSGAMLRPGFFFDRSLPEDTYLSPDYVLAVLTTALWWNKSIDISWMQMDVDPSRGIEVPIQHHRNGAVLLFIEDDSQVFGIVGPDDESPVRVRTDLTTDIALAALIPEPVVSKDPQVQQAAARRKRDREAAWVRHPRESAVGQLPVTSVQAEPSQPGLQVDG